MAKKKTAGEADAPPPFVFQGTVKKVRAATMKDVPVSDRTAIVHVDEVISAPASFTHHQGEDITVELAGRAKVSAGDQFVFHADSWMFGDSVALRAVSQEKPKPAHRAMVAAAATPVQRRIKTQLQEHLDDADLVVSGRVDAVEAPPEAPEPVRRGIAAAAPAPASRPVSEHDPKWRQAVITVDETHKGQHASRQVKVMFPSSTDVRWYRAPKFHAGQRAVFLLHKTTVKADDHRELRSLAAAAGAEDVDVYTALHPEDVQPITDQGAVKALIG
jgi:hypothetical protein